MKVFRLRYRVIDGYADFVTSYGRIKDERIKNDQQHFTEKALRYILDPKALRGECRTNRFLLEA